MQKACTVILYYTPCIDRLVQRNAGLDRITKTLMEMAEAKEEEAPSQEMCIDQNGEHACLLTLFPGRLVVLPSDMLACLLTSSDHD